MADAGRIPGAGHERRLAEPDLEEVSFNWAFADQDAYWRFLTARWPEPSPPSCGDWTREPIELGPRSCPYQWSWGSALIAVSYPLYDQDRAVREFPSLLDAQWKAGSWPRPSLTPIPTTTSLG
jgi:hypothetical protein